MSDAYVGSANVPQINGAELQRLSILEAYKVPSILNSGAVRLDTETWRMGTGTSLDVLAVTDNTEVQDTLVDGSDQRSDSLTIATSQISAQNKMVTVGLHRHIFEDQRPDFNYEAVLASAIANKMRAAWQDAVITEADTTDLTYTAAANITFADVTAAVFSNWGDKWQYFGTPVLVLHPAVYNDLCNITEVKTSSSYDSAGGPFALRSGFVPGFFGMRVVSYKGTDELYTAGTGYHKNFILGENAIDLYFKKEMDSFDTVGARNNMIYKNVESRFAVDLKKVNGLNPAIEFLTKASIAVS